MPFPFTLGPNIYVRSDFNTPGYSSKFPRFLQDVFSYGSPGGSTDVLSPVNFSSGSFSITFPEEWGAVGETLLLYHRESGSYVHVKLTSGSGTSMSALTVSALPQKGSGTFSTGVKAVRALPRNYPNTPYSTTYDVAMESHQIHSVDFLEDFIPIRGGTYTGDSNTSDSLSIVTSPSLPIDFFATSAVGNEISPFHSSQHLGRGWARFKSAPGSIYNMGGYFGALRNCGWSQWCFQPVATGLMYTGWQAYPTVPGGGPLIGYPHELIHGRAEMGPFVEFSYGGAMGAYIKVGNGTDVVNLPLEDVMRLLSSGSQAITVELKRELSSVNYRIYNDRLYENSVELSGTLPASSNPVVSGVFRPYFGGRGEYLVDYFWARSST